MRLPTRDLLATALVGAAGVLYVLWNAGFAPVGLGSVRATGLVMLGLGFVASASAVVPSFDDLMRGNKVYLAVTSIIGTGAFVAGSSKRRHDQTKSCAVTGCPLDQPLFPWRK